ncbi:MAG: oxygen-dependent coproporphyrinogen oxidase [Methylacidiphilales bacterium]|nr:oxygen-dependent coproporphyrinogen oxidase [Candidatus Methylacidiphilales bacterium]
MLSTNKDDFLFCQTEFKQIHSAIITSLGDLEQKVNFIHDNWKSELGYGVTSVISQGEIFEKGGVNFSNVSSNSLPASATATRPELVGKKWQACGVSLVMHPKNPHVPTCHANFRIFTVQNDDSYLTWFGGGYDLTPYIPYQEDCKLWHNYAKQTCDLFGKELYDQFKKQCDKYFFLPHRNETRGVGGIFFDDFSLVDLNTTMMFIQSLASSFQLSYTTIVKKRSSQLWNDRERQFQCFRRGRYVEFNLLYDRGTLFGIQSKGRVESILMSLPPETHWHYQFSLNEHEKELISLYFKPRDWL